MAISSHDDLLLNHWNAQARKFICGRQGEKHTWHTHTCTYVHNHSCELHHLIHATKLYQQTKLYHKHYCLKVYPRIPGNTLTMQVWVNFTSIRNRQKGFHIITNVELKNPRILEWKGILRTIPSCFIKVSIRKQRKVTCPVNLLLWNCFDLKDLLKDLQRSPF